MPNTVSSTVSDDTLNRIITIESSGNPNARVRTSSALGLGQFLNATWLNTLRVHAPSVMTGKTTSQLLALRTDPSFAVEMLARFTEDNQKVVGMNCTPGDLYLAHFLGAGAAKVLFRASQSAPVSQYVSDAAVRANRSVMEGKTVGQVRAWAARRMAQSGGRDWVKKYYRVAAIKPLPIYVPSHDSMVSDGDPELLTAQSQLKGMNYYVGELDGLWGGKTSGAISGFINDREGFMPAPTSMEQYKVAAAQITTELDRAEAAHFKRPVTNARATEDPDTVARVAPEVVPARTSLWTTATGFVVTFTAAIWNTISEWFSTIWNLFTTNKDNLPASATDPTFIEGVFHRVPVSVWLFLVAALLALIGVNAYRSIRKINCGVANGTR